MKQLMKKVARAIKKNGQITPAPQEPERVGNMNMDDPVDYRQANLLVNDYFIIEVVSVPPEFDISNHLKMREAAGIFEHENVDLKQLTIISEVVRCSAIFSALNNPVINPHTCMYFLHIMEELKLIIKSIDNPIKRNREEYMTFLKKWKQDSHTYVRGQDVLRLNFVIINLVPLYQQQVMDEAVEAVNSILKHTADVKQMKETL